MQLVHDIVHVDVISVVFVFISVIFSFISISSVRMNGRMKGERLLVVVVFHSGFEII